MGERIRKFKDTGDKWCKPAVARHEQEWKVNCLMLVDDTALVTYNWNGLQELVNGFGFVCKKKVIVSKSKVMVINGDSGQNSVNVRLGGRRMEEVKTPKYVGVNVLNGRRLVQK